jgi:ketosteroid isomerase-like protein
MTRAVAALVLLALSAAASAAGAADQVAAATQAFYQALNSADGSAAAKYLLPKGDSFPRNGGLLQPEEATAEDAARALRASFASGLRFQVTIQHLEVKVYGTAAVATFYTEGTTIGRDKSVAHGTYRASYFWVKDHGQWKIAHFHISPLRGNSL